MRKSLTLIETLISMVILTLIVGALSVVLTTGNLSYYSEMDLIDLQQQIRLAVHGMTREIRQSPSSDITVASNGEQINFSIINVSNPINYYLQNDSLIREHPAGTQRVMVEDVNSLSFCCIGGLNCTDCNTAHSVSIAIDAEKTVRQRTVSFNLSEKVKLRNE